MTPKAIEKLYGAELGANSYEASLTDAQRRELYAMLRSDLPFDELLKNAPPWGSGKEAGKKPSLGTLHRINERLDFEAILLSLEGTSALVEGKEKKSRANVYGKGEQILDRALELIGHEVIRRTLNRRNAGERTAAAKLLLQRADQRREDRRLAMMEAESKKKTKGKNKAVAGLTREEREERMKQIFGK